VEEEQDPFLALFPHRFDYIYAHHPEPGQKPAWQTEKRYPLSDRLIQQGSYLFGVRFGPQTNYCLLDIDIASLYHPRQDKLAVSRIVASLESIGLVSYVICTSSYSNGLHLYFPFTEPQSSWELASVIALLLEQAGFQLKPGQLELFPNPRPYVVNSAPKLFNAHRLPLQTGSYLLNQDFQPIRSDRSRFVQQWQFVQTRNTIDRFTLKRILKQARHQYFCVSGKADKFINDLNAEIEPGWTGPGQTNRLLGRITMRSYIFHHVITGGSPLEGQALIDEIVDVATSLPGYQEWCGHQHEINQRAEEWARCIENSHYFHYGSAQGKYKTRIDSPKGSSVIESTISALPSWNQQQSETTREKIRQALADLLDQNCLPSAATARFHALRSYQIGGGSLYRHRDLWHPKYIQENTSDPELNLLDDNLPRQADQMESTLNSSTCEIQKEFEQISTSLLSMAGGENALCHGSGNSGCLGLPVLAGNSQQFRHLCIDWPVDSVQTPDFDWSADPLVQFDRDQEIESCQIVVRPAQAKWLSFLLTQPTFCLTIGCHPASPGRLQYLCFVLSALFPWLTEVFSSINGIVPRLAARDRADP
jgi:hypothetical protein